MMHTDSMNVNRDKSDDAVRWDEVVGPDEAGQRDAVVGPDEAGQRDAVVGPDEVVGP
jgi:hypothetical protein